ncbi:MAG: ABC transporter permease [Propionibacteriaceae bacterium]|nr:ABC transporter permease [Propionibacteriaceae bacterium]
MLLVMLAYLLGVAALVGSMGVVGSATGQIVARLTSAGSSQMRVVDASRSSSTWDVSSTRAGKISGLEGVVEVAPARTFTTTSNKISRLAAAEQPYQGHLVVTDERFFGINQLKTRSGQVALLSNTWGGTVAVLGSRAAQDLGVADVSPGVQIWANERSVDVAAVLEASGDPITDTSLFLSPATMAYLSDQLDDYVIVRCQPGYAEPLANAIPPTLQPTNPGQVQVSVVAQLADLQQSINSDLSGLLAVVGWITLALSSLTAATTMVVSVQHRAPEIALRRAMGASRMSIWRLFTYEGVVVGGSGAILGTTCGIGLTWMVARYNEWPVCLGVSIPLTGLAVGLGAGALAAVVPALYAARRDPAAVLRTV